MDVKRSMQPLCKEGREHNASLKAQPQGRSISSISFPKCCRERREQPSFQLSCSSSALSTHGFPPGSSDVLSHSTALCCPSDTQLQSVWSAWASAGEACWVSNYFFFTSQDSKRRSFLLKSPQESRSISNICICV